jgi:hypothetical protein
MKSKVFASLLIGTCLAVGAEGVASAIIQPAGSEISNRDIQNFAEMRRRGLVTNAGEYNSLHPFVRANWSALQRGEIPMAGLQKDTRTGAATATDIQFQATGRQDLLEFSAWLKGGPLPSKLSGAPAGLFKKLSAEVLAEPVRKWSTVIFGDIKSIVQKGAGGGSSVSHDVRDILGLIPDALAGKGKLLRTMSKGETAMHSLECSGSGTLLCFAGKNGMGVKFTGHKDAVRVTLTQGKDGAVRGYAVVRHRNSPSDPWRFTRRSVGPIGNGLKEQMSRR